MPNETTTEASRRIVKGMYDSALGGDLAGFMELLHPDLVVLEPSFLPYGGVTRGAAQFPALLQTITQYLRFETIKVESLVADGDVVVAFLSAKAVADGSELQLGERSVVRDGKVVEMKIFYHEGGSLFPRAGR